LFGKRKGGQKNTNKTYDAILNSMRENDSIKSNYCDALILGMAVIVSVISKLKCKNNKR